MPVGQASGYPRYSGSDPLATDSRIPTLWAARALERFYERTFLPQISTSDYIGDLNDMGDKVIINTIPVIKSAKYVKGQALKLSIPTSPSVEFTVSKALAYNVGINQVDVKQGKIKDWISKYADEVGKQNKIDIETEVLSTVFADVDASNKGLTAGKRTVGINLGTSAAPVAISSTNVLQMILRASTVLTEQDRPMEDRWMIIPTSLAAIIKDSDIKRVDVTGDSMSPLRNGMIGRIDNFTLYESNLVFRETTGSLPYHILFGHKSALIYISNFTKTVFYMPQEGFEDAVKGLIVYDFKTIQPASMGEIVATLSL